MVTQVKKPMARRRGHTRISPKNQVTLPVEALRRSGLGSGDPLRVDVAGPGRLTLTRSADPIETLAGAFHYPKGYLKKLRAEWRD